MRAGSSGEDSAMAEAPASSRVTPRNGIRQGNGAGRAGHGTAGIAARTKPEGHGPDHGGPDNDGRLQHTEADLEPIRARLAAFARGDFRPRDRKSTRLNSSHVEISS